MEGARCILEAGRVHGITAGAAFRIYPNRESMSLPPSGVLVAIEENIRAFTTGLVLRGGTFKRFSGSGVAIQVKAGTYEDFSIHIPLIPSFLPIFLALAKEMGVTEPDYCRIKFVEKDESMARISLSSDQGNYALVGLGEARAREYGLDRLSHSVHLHVEDVGRFLRAASRYYYYLDAHKRNQQITEGIKIEVFELDTTPVPSQHWFIDKTGPDLIKDGKVETEMDEEDYPWYGLRITNNTELDLHTACCSFNHADLSIRE